MSRTFFYRITSRDEVEGLIKMSVTFPDYMLASFLSYIHLKRRQSPTLTLSERKAAMEEHYQFLSSVVSSEFDAQLSKSVSVKSAISKTLVSLCEHYPTLSIDGIKHLLRGSGRLAGTRL